MSCSAAFVPALHEGDALMQHLVSLARAALSSIALLLYSFACLCFALLCFVLVCFALLYFALVCFAQLCFTEFRSRAVHVRTVHGPEPLTNPRLLRARLFADTNSEQIHIHWADRMK